MEIFSLPDWEIDNKNIQEGEDYYLVPAKPLQKVQSCKFCPGDLFYQHDYRYPEYKHNPLNGKKVIIRAQIQRVKCRNCGHINQQPAPFIDLKHRATISLIEYVRRVSTKKTFKEIENETGLNEKTVRRIFADHADQAKSQYDFEMPEYLGFRELRVHRTQRLIVINVKKSEIHEVLSNPSNKQLINFLNSIKSLKVKSVFIPIYSPYREIIEANAPEVKIVAEPLLLAEFLQNSIRDCIKCFSNVVTDPQQKKTARSLLSSQSDGKYMLGLFLKRQEELTKQEQFPLYGMIKMIDELEEIYSIKEAFYDIYKSFNKTEALFRYYNWKNSLPEHFRNSFRDVFEAFENWGEYIFNFFDDRIIEPFTDILSENIKELISRERANSFNVLRAKLVYINKREQS